MRKIQLGDIGLFILWIIVAIILASMGKAQAQAAPHVDTVFEQGCIEVINESTYRIHFHYTSDGVDRYAFKMGAVIGANSGTKKYTGHAKTNVPNTFKTSEGYHDDFYLEGKSEDSPYTFTLLFTDDIGTAVMLLNTWDYQTWCESGQYSPPPPPTKTPTPAPVQVQAQQPVSQLVVSTGRTCAIKYLENNNVVLVCDG